MFEVVGGLVGLVCIMFYTAINVGMLIAVRIIKAMWSLMAR